MMNWDCGNPREIRWCFATARTEYLPVPPNLDAYAQEMFDSYPFPKEGWKLQACDKHQELFSDYHEEPD